MTPFKQIWIQPDSGGGGEGGAGGRGGAWGAGGGGGGGGGEGRYWATPEVGDGPSPKFANLH